MKKAAKTALQRAFIFPIPLLLVTLRHDESRVGHEFQQGFTRYIHSAKTEKLEKYSSEAEKNLPRIPENLIERSDFVRFSPVQANMNGSLATLPRVSWKARNHGMQRGQRQDAQLSYDWTSHPLPYAICRDILINVT